MSDQPLPLETQFSGIPNMSNREFHRKYVHFNVISKSDDIEQQKVSKPLVHKIAPHHVTNTPMKLVWHHHKNIHFLVGKSMHSRPTLHTQPPPYTLIQMSCLA